MPINAGNSRNRRTNRRARPDVANDGPTNIINEEAGNIRSNILDEAIRNYLDNPTTELNIGTPEPDIEMVSPRYYITTNPSWGITRVDPPNHGLSSKKIRIEEDDTIVKATDGKKYPREECWYSGEKYFHKSHKDVRLDAIDGKPLHISRANIIVGNLTIQDGKSTMENAYVSNNNYPKCIPIMSNKYGFDSKIVDLSNIIGWEYKEDFGTGLIVDKDYNGLPIDEIKNYETFKNYHNIRDKSVKEQMKLGMISPSYISTEGLRYTFGVELEMSRGFLPAWKGERYYNVSCVRDGSLNPGEEQGGPEIVTGILTGDTGVNHLQEICLELSKRTKVNSSCGVHLHLGNIDFTPKFLVNSYRLALLLEKEIFSTLPTSRRKNRYCRKLTKFDFRPAIGDTKSNILEIEEDYNQLFEYISFEHAKYPDSRTNKGKQHPMGAKCSYNHDTPRYCWLNYVPAMFNTRGSNGSMSIEIRNHSGTTSFIKIRNWLLFFMAFTAFIERYPELIKPGITMDDIINKIMPKKAKSLSMYFNNRKAKFVDNTTEAEEYIQTEEPKKTIKELINN